VDVRSITGMKAQLNITEGAIEHLRSFATAEKRLLLKLNSFYETLNPENDDITRFDGLNLVIYEEGPILEQTRNKKEIQIQEMTWLVGEEDYSVIKERPIDLAFIPSRLRSSFAVVLIVK